MAPFDVNLHIGYSQEVSYHLHRGLISQLSYNTPWLPLRIISLLRVHMGPYCEHKTLKLFFYVNINVFTPTLHTWGKA